MTGHYRSIVSQPSARSRSRLLFGRRSRSFSAGEARSASGRTKNGMRPRTTLWRGSAQNDWVRLAGQNLARGAVGRAQLQRSSGSPLSDAVHCLCAECCSAGSDWGRKASVDWSLNAHRCVDTVHEHDSRSPPIGRHAAGATVPAER